uniref:Uncharacterized protein n=1 Tax=Rhizophora mucronata TaxID=61149 RepID=A0A2P2PGW2_RHIMU
MLRLMLHQECCFLQTRLLHLLWI